MTESSFPSSTKLSKEMADKIYSDEELISRLLTSITIVILQSFQHGYILSPQICLRPNYERENEDHINS